MDDKDCPYFLEANLVPGMTQRPNVYKRQGCQNLWNIEKPYSPSTDKFNFNMNYLKELDQQLGEVSFKDILKSYRRILRMDRIVS